MSERRIVFLDMDGVLCTTRAAMAIGDHGLIRALDPIGIQFLNRLYASAPYKIVVSSTWRREVCVPTVLQAAGCVVPFADPWGTAVASVHDSRDTRPSEIRAWIGSHGPVDRYVIFDDDAFNWTDEQRARWVRCDTFAGITLANMDRALELFGVDWPQLQGRAHGFVEPIAASAESTA